jgi:hypothetical protein
MDDNPPRDQGINTVHESSRISSANTRRFERSCALCHRRKVRCDKKLPCSTCTRMGVLCCYPSANKPSARKEKATISDIASRLAQLERTIVAISSDVSPRMPKENPHEALAEVSSQMEEKRRLADEHEFSSSEMIPAEMLVKQGHGDSGHYVNEVLLSRVLEEVTSRNPHVDSRRRGCPVSLCRELTPCAGKRNPVRSRHSNISRFGAHWYWQPGHVSAVIIRVVGPVISSKARAYE